MTLFDKLVRTGIAGVSRICSKSGLVILIYHRVLPQPDPMLPDVPDAVMFSMHMSLISRFFRVLPLDSALTQLHSGRLESPAVAVTFDDGYADNLEVALPILRAFNIPATVFVAPGFLDGGIMFNDAITEIFRRVPTGLFDAQSLNLGAWRIDDWASRRLAAANVIRKVKYLPLDQRQLMIEKMLDLSGVDLPDDLMLTTNQLQRLYNSGVGIGAHTVNHPILAALDDDAAKCEIRSSKERLEQLLGEPLVLFAYPNGKPGVDYLQKHVQMVSDAGFRFAVSTREAVARKSDPVMEFPRFGPWDRTSSRLLLRMIRAQLLA
jgi:peptidoglycan/xylan/chitin deacetylase (PgdA/CDA1 family)